MLKDLNCHVRFERLTMQCPVQSIIVRWPCAPKILWCRLNRNIGTTLARSRSRRLGGMDDIPMARFTRIMGARCWAIWPMVCSGTIPLELISRNTILTIWIKATSLLDNKTYLCLESLQSPDCLELQPMSCHNSEEQARRTQYRVQQWSELENHLITGALQHLLMKVELRMKVSATFRVSKVSTEVSKWTQARPARMLWPHTVDVK